MDKLEQVARAIYERGAKVPWAGFERTEWDDIKPDGKLFFFDCARAAIEVLREPSEEMVEAAESLDDSGSSIFGEPFVAASHDDAWRAMIDAILNEAA